MCAAGEDLRLAGKRGSGVLSIGERVRKAIDSLEAEGQMPSFYQVAERAAVARSTLYRNKALRVCIEEARERFSARAVAPAHALGQNSVLLQSQSLRTEIEKLRKELAAAQSERDALERRLAMRYMLDRPSAFAYGVCHLLEAA